MSNYYSNIPTKKQIIVPSDDGTRAIGAIRHDKVFYKFNFNSQKHICHKHGEAIGLDLAAFTDYVKPNAHTIRCIDKITNHAYSISVAEFEAHAIVDNLGVGMQMFVPTKFWHIKTSTNTRYGGKN